MYRFECPSCKTRLYSAAHPRDLISDVCPVCGESSLANATDTSASRQAAPRAAEAVRDATPVTIETG